MLRNKSIKFFINYFLGPLLFAWLCFFIYRQIVSQPRLAESWAHIQASLQSSKIIYCLAALVLVPVNWGIEAYKWQLCVEAINPVSFTTAFKAVLAGVAFSVTMPNRVGEYLGRMMYVPEGRRLKTIPVTLVGSGAQLLVTLITGTAGVLILKRELLHHYPLFTIWFQFGLYGLLTLSLFLTVIYFYSAAFSGLLRRWIRNEKYSYLFESLAALDGRLLGKILLLSFLRYSVFIIQYILVLYLFGIFMAAGLIVCIMSLVFLAMAIVPSIALLELGLRGEIMISLMKLFTPNLLGLGLTAVTVPFINLILPAMAGSLLMLNKKVFKKKHETI
jgi:hypothetical protein